MHRIYVGHSSPRNKTKMTKRMMDEEDEMKRDVWMDG